MWLIKLGFMLVCFVLFLREPLGGEEREREPLKIEPPCITMKDRLFQQRPCSLSSP